MHEAALRPVVAGWKLVIVRCSKGLAFDLEEQLQIGAERQIGGRRELPGRQRRPEVDGTPGDKVGRQRDDDVAGGEDRKSTRLISSHYCASRMTSSARKKKTDTT